MMNFSAVKHQFKPVSDEVVERLAKKFSNQGLGEQSVLLHEVGLDALARQVVKERDQKRQTLAGKSSY